MPCVYVLWSTRLRKRYVGSTNELSRRLREHNAGRNRFTKGGIPWEVIHTEQYDDIIGGSISGVVLEERCGPEVAGLSAPGSKVRTVWRGAGAVELATLERWYTGNGIVGSNPTLSA